MGRSSHLQYWWKHLCALKSFYKKSRWCNYFDSNNNIIKVNTPTNLSAFAEISSSKEYKNFKVSVYSEKSIYESNELINVWGDMTYLGDEKISIRHGEPLLNFFIRDDQGNYYEAPHYVSSDNGFIDRNNQYFSPNNLWVITYFNRKFYQNDNINLKPGRYTIGLRPYFSTSELETTEVSDNLCTSVQITVKWLGISSEIKF